MLLTLRYAQSISGKSRDPPTSPKNMLTGQEILRNMIRRRNRRTSSLSGVEAKLGFNCEVEDRMSSSNCAKPNKGHSEHRLPELPAHVPSNIFEECTAVEEDEEKG